MNFLFDLYGTLIDIRTDEQSAGFWEKIAALLGRSGQGGAVAAQYGKLCKDASLLLPEGGEIDLLRVFSALCALSSRPCAPAAFAEAFRAASMRKFCVYEGVFELLEGLHVRGAGVYLLSNAQACFTRAELSRAKLCGCFDGILLSSEAGFKKPSPRFFEIAFRRFGLDPRTCVYVGNDLRDDVGGAHAAGIPCVYIETAQSGKYADAPVPDFRAEDRASLARILFSLAGQSFVQ